MHRLVEQALEHEQPSPNTKQQRSTHASSNTTSHNKKVSAMLTRDAILKSIQSVAAEVEVPELGGSVGINRLSFLDTIRLTTPTENDGDHEQINHQAFLIRLLIACVCDKKGKRLFKDSDFAILEQLPASAMQKMADVALEVNGLSDTAVEDAVKK